MIEFTILKKSTRSRARLGILKTPHSEVETPALVSVATQAVVKTLTSEEALGAGCQMLICNTFHLHQRPGEQIVKKSGGLHQFMHWAGPLMTDSGGFQVFSLGFGHDLGVGKILKYFPGSKKSRDVIREASSPRLVKIADDGVHFRSPFDGRMVFLGPKESIRIQEALGADIIFAFDECTAPLSTLEYAKKAMARTHRWARVSRESKKSTQALFGIVQGSRFRVLREESSRFINSLGFDGFGIGGDLGATKTEMQKILNWTIPHLDEQKPRHLLGIGYIEDIEQIITAGIDSFDCTVPTHYARRGVAFVGREKLNIGQARFLTDKTPIDKECRCFVCQNYRRNYIAHLLRVREMTAFRLLTLHNLFMFNAFVKRVREKIKQGKL